MPHGGRRPSAGRPRIPSGTRIQFSVPGWVYDALVALERPDYYRSRIAADILFGAIKGDKKNWADALAYAQRLHRHAKARPKTKG